MAEKAASVSVSLRVSAELIEILDKIAAALERPRSWVMLCALRQYIADEGQEVLDVQDGIAELDRGEVVRPGAKSGLMVGSPAVVAARFGKGWAVGVSPHPEQTEGLRDLVPSAIRWALAHPVK